LQKLILPGSGLTQEQRDVDRKSRPNFTRGDSLKKREAGGYSAKAKSTKRGKKKYTGPGGNSLSQITIGEDRAERARAPLTSHFSVPGGSGRISFTDVKPITTNSERMSLLYKLCKQLLQPAPQKQREEQRGSQREIVGVAGGVCDSSRRVKTANNFFGSLRIVSDDQKQAQNDDGRGEEDQKK